VYRLQLLNPTPGIAKNWLPLVPRGETSVSGTIARKLTKLFAFRRIAGGLAWRARATADRLSPHRAYRWWLGWNFDRRYNADTRNIVPVPTDGGEVARHATRYRGSTVGFVPFVLTRVPLRIEDAVFVDLGSGKGRVLVEAAAFPFRAIVGIEFSPPLHAAATRLVSEYERRNRCLGRVDLKCMSAADYVLPGYPAVIYLYNPFDAAVLRSVIDRLLRRAAPTRIVYLNPQAADVIEGTQRFELVASGKFWRDEYRVYDLVGVDGAHIRWRQSELERVIGVDSGAASRSETPA
jgi:hypothetical protein